MLGKYKTSVTVADTESNKEAVERHISIVPWDEIPAP